MPFDGSRSTLFFLSFCRSLSLFTSTRTPDFYPPSFRQTTVIETPTVGRARQNVLSKIGRLRHARPMFTRIIERKSGGKGGTREDGEPGERAARLGEDEENGEGEFHSLETIRETAEKGKGRAEEEEEDRDVVVSVGGGGSRRGTIG